jgi:hypothetical protein
MAGKNDLPRGFRKFHGASGPELICDDGKRKNRLLDAFSWFDFPGDWCFTGAANGEINKRHTEFFTKVNEVNKGIMYTADKGRLTQMQNVNGQTR